MAEVVLGAVSIVSGCLVAPVNRLCGYVISYEGDVRKLKAKVAELGNARQNVQDSIKDAQNNVKPIKAHVNKWMEDVEKDTGEAHRVLDDNEKAKKTCFYRWLPKVRYRLGREARRKAEDIQGLIDRKPSGEVYDDPPPGLVDGTSDVISSAGDRGDTIFDSRASILKDIMNALDDEKRKVIGVYGPGGVGKTTLLEEVNKKLRKEGRPFNMIVKAKVSQTPELNDIQYQIADDLNLNLKDKQSQQGRRDLLFQRLQKDPNEKVLIILDDLWKEFDLKEVGIPSGDESRGCKLLLTSRFKDVLEQMKCDTPIFHLTGLKDNEAFELFEKTVGDKLKDNEDLKVIAHQVVNKLAGLPLLITSVASTLKHSNVHTWRTMLIKIEEPNVETIVKLSYDHLKSKDAKTLFLLCGLIGGTIQVKTLLALGMGLGLFEEFGRTMQDSRDRLNTILDELRSACLLLDDGNDKNNVTIHVLPDDDDYKNKVTIHDLYSEVVVSTSFGGQNSLMMNSNYGSWSKEKLEKCWAICLADVDKKRLDKLMTCQFPDLKILMLSQSKGWRWMGEHEHEVGDCSGLLDFTYMKELRVLYFQFMHIASLPPSIGILGNLHSLYLVHCDVQDVTILGNLKALQILTFTRSTISRLPKEIGELTNLRSLNLIKCYKLETIEPGVLNRLTNLEELYICDFSRWMGKDQIPSESCNARLAELKSLTKLSALAILILDPTMLLKDGDLPFGNLNRFKINIGNQWLYEGLTTMNLTLEGCDSILSRKWFEKNLQKTQYLYLCELSEFKESPRELCTQGFREVMVLHIRDSPSIKYIADSSKGLPLTAFGKLEYFYLENLINLEKICHGPIVPECFKKLKAVRVQQCDQLKYLWCLLDVQRLVQLEKIEVWKCDSMQSIVTHDAGEDIVSTDKKVELPNVRHLVLNELPNVTSFCTKVEIASEDIPIQVSLPRLESLMMVGLLGLEKILYSEPSLKYNNLKSLEIGESKSTSIILKDWVLKLPNLESMTIVRSPSVEVVFDLVELKVIKEVEILSRLSTLTLSKLPNLRRMWKQDVQLQGISILQNLKKLFINNTGLSFLFPLYVAKCLREIKEIEVEDCPNMKAVIVDEEGRADGTADIIEFPLLKRLSISRCPTEKFFSYPQGKKESITTTSDSPDNYSDSFFDQKIILPGLEALILHSLGSFKSIWHNELPKSSSNKVANLTLQQDLQSQGISIFQNLKVLSIKNIGLSFLFPVSMAECLRKIREIEVEDCPNMKAVIVDEEGRDDGTNDIIEFQLLERLSISHCPTKKFFSYPQGKKESMTTTSDSQDNDSDSFFDQKISLPCLEALILHSLGSFKSIWHGELPKSSSNKVANLTLQQDLQSQGILIFQNLKVLSINNMGLSFLFPVSMAKCLREIEEIKVEDCPNMKAVIVDEEGRDDGTVDIIEFPLLERLFISRCPLEKFFLYPHGKKESMTTTSDSQDNYSDSFFDQKISLPSLEKLKLESVGSLKRIWHSGLPKSSFDKLAGFMGRLHNLKVVKISKCPSLESLFDFGSLDSYTEQTIVLLPQLEEVKVLSCPSLESLFNWGPLDSSMEHKFVLLPELESVVVSGAGRLKHVVMGDSKMFLGFLSLKEVFVHNCPELRYLFPNYTATTLKELGELDISKCEQLKEVIPEEEGSRSKAEVMSFPSLATLVICRCPSFRAFIWSPTSAERQLGEMIEENDESPQPLFNNMVTFPNLEKLYIEDVQCKELWNNQISDDSFCKLESLILKGCDNLQQIAPSHMWKKLQDCLKTLEVESCRSIEIIYESNGTVAKSGNLRTLDLCDLDNLRNIWRYDSLPTIPFPNLRYVKAVRCSRLDMLFATFTAKFLGQIKKLVVGSCEDMELIAGYEECEEVTSKTITFSGLTTLRLYNLPKFKSFLPEKYSAKFQSSDVWSRTEPNQGNRSVEESEGEAEEFDLAREELDSEFEWESEGE